MAVSYQKELDFAVAVMRRMRLGVHLLHPDDSLRVLDSGMRERLGMDADYETAFHVAQQWRQENTVYKIIDQFMCHYIYFHLPDMETPTDIVIGPYLTEDLSSEMLLEQAEKLGLGAKRLLQIDYYAALPVLNDPSPLMNIVACLGEAVWGGARAFQMVDVNYERMISVPAARSTDAPIEETDVLKQMQMMEERYAFENELMEIVEKGLINRAEGIMSGVSMLNYQQRCADPLRNMKNYCIICNTLLRKAAQRGGIHPFDLDRLSSEFAHKIENAPTFEKAHSLIGDMIRAYCRLVHTHAGRRYAGIVQKMMTYIDANISGDLSLGKLAAVMRVSSGYLSDLFHRETGKTLTQHVTQQRMKAALELLSSTKLQIQTVSQLCGFADPNYFGKVFKRFYGVTPQQYRRDEFGLYEHHG